MKDDARPGRRPSAGQSSDTFPRWPYCHFGASLANPLARLRSPFAPVPGCRVRMADITDKSHSPRWPRWLLTPAAETDTLPIKLT